jgi:hypothetical protein
METFEEAIKKIHNIEKILDVTEKTETFNIVQQVFSSTMSLGFMFDNFLTTTASVQFALLKNADFWINNNWERIVEEEGLCEHLKDFLFTILPAQTDIPEFIKEQIATFQARFFMKTFPAPWETFFAETIFDGSSLNHEMLFIYGLCKMLSTPLYNEREITITFRDALNGIGVTGTLQEKIFAGIAALEPYAFAAIGFFSICFDNSWVGNGDLFGAFCNGMTNQSTLENTLEAINLILQSRFSDAEKVSVVQAFNLIEFITTETDNDAIRAKYSKIVYTLIQIFPDTDEVYGVLVSTALTYITANDDASKFACLALQSALPKNKADFASPFVENALIKLNAINHADTSMVPNKLSESLLFLIYSAIRENYEGAFEGFTQFVQSIEAQPLEDLPTGVTYLQFLSNFKKVFVVLSNQTTDPVSEYFDVFSGLAGAQSEVAEETKAIFYNFYSCYLLPAVNIIPQASLPEVITELFGNVFQFITCGIPDDLSKMILKDHFLPFVRKYAKYIAVEPPFILELAGTGDLNLLAISGYLTRAIEDLSVRNELIAAVLQSQIELIQGSETGPRMPFFNATNFFISLASDIENPELCQAVGQLFNEINTTAAFQYDDGIVGNVLSVLPYLGDVGFELLGTIAPYAKNPNGINGLCRAIALFVHKSGSSNPYKFKEITATQEWQVEMFAQVFELVKGIFEQFITQNYYYIDDNLYASMFVAFYLCASYVNKSLPDELFAELIGFTQHYLVQLSLFPQMINAPLWYLNRLFANNQKREAFDLTDLIPSIHSFIFPARFNVHLPKSQIPSEYQNLMMNMSKGTKYDVFSLKMKEMLNQFQMEDEFSNTYLQAFEQSSGISLTILLEKIIFKRAFSLHP